MAESKLVFDFDPERGYLSINKGIPRYFEQVNDEIEEGILCKRNPKTEAVESVDLLYFSAEVPQEERDRMLGRAVSLLSGMDSEIKFIHHTESKAA